MDAVAKMPFGAIPNNEDGVCDVVLSTLRVQRTLRAMKRLARRGSCTGALSHAPRCPSSSRDEVKKVQLYVTKDVGYKLTT